MKKYFLCFLVMVISLTCFATQEETLFEKANLLYQQGKFKDAIKLYEGIAASGKVAPELYFNLGNAYYKTGDNVSAIVYYERAARLAPQDEDIRFNLHIANLKAIDKITPLPEFFLTRWWHRIILLNSADAWAKITICLSFLTAFLVICFLGLSSYFLKRLIFVGIFVSLFVFITAFFVSKSAWENQTKNHYAILSKNSTYVKSSPDEKSTDLFILHEGIKMKVLDQIGVWKKITIADGNEGWIKENEIIII